MKKLSKFIYFIFAFALITCMAIFNPAITFADAAEVVTGDSISISTSKISSTVAAGQNLLIPVPTVSSNMASATKSIIVKDRTGKTYTYNCTTGEASASNYFTLYDASKNVTTEKANVAYVEPTITGKGSYYVQYKVENGDKTYYSNEKLVQVTDDTYTWEFNAEDGTKNIIPSITAPNARHILPLPKLVNAATETDVKVFTTEDLLTADEKGENIIITKSGADVTKDVTSVEDGKIYFVPTLAADEDNATYTIKYKSTISAFADRSYTIKVQRNYKTEANIEVTHNTITNVQVGAVTTFPTANVTDKTHNKTKIEVNNVITIKKGSEVVAKLNPNEYTYTFTSTGTYTIYYEATDAYGNTDTSAAYSFDVRNRAPYLVDYADSYVTTGDNWEDNVVTGVAHTIPSEVGYGGFWLPAIYAKDYATTNYENLKFSRRLELSTDSSVWFDLDKSTTESPEHGNAAYDENKSYNDRVEFRFPGDASEYAGKTFKLIYTAKGEGDSEAYATRYTIKVANVEELSYNIDKGLIINFPSINTAIDPNAELSFTSATAKEEPTDDELVADERVEVRTYYYYGAKTEVESALKSYITKIAAEYKAETGENYIEKYGYNFDRFISDTSFTLDINKLTSKDGKTTLKLDASEYTNQDKVTIFAVAINDQNQFVIKAREVAINNTNEIVPPTIVSAVESYIAGAYNQNVTVTLPSVEFTDTNDNSLQVDVRCYVDDIDQNVGVTIKEFVQDTLNNKWGIKSAELTTTYAGTYYVVYTATDDAGNSVSYVSTFEVANTEKGYIEVENGSSISKFVGEDVTLNINLAGNGEYTDFVPTITWGENKPSGLGDVPNSFKFDKAGTYVATISGKYKLNNEPMTAEPSVTVTITVKEPTLSWSDAVTEYFTEKKGSTAEVGDRIDLDVISATEKGSFDLDVNAEPKVVYKDNNGKEVNVTLEYDAEGQHYYFIANEDAVYTVSYTATTDYNSETKSYTITCGDHYNPTVVIAGNKLQDSKITYNGTDIKLTAKLTQKEINDIDQPGKYILTVTAKEGDKTVFTYDIDVTLKDTNSSKAIVDLDVNSDDYKIELTGDNCSSNGTNSWTISGVGSYELKLTVYDENDNATPKTIKFNVANKTEPKSIKDNVVGIVLIVVSVVILGGVILFFALAGKRNKSKRKSINKN